MDNRESKTVHPGTLEDQSSDKDQPIYKLVDMHGNGDLVKQMRLAKITGDYTFVDSHIEVIVADFLYNGGKGKILPVAELVKLRNTYSKYVKEVIKIVKERNAKLGAFSRKKGKGKSGPNILADLDQDNMGDFKKALKLLDGGKGGKNESKYREMCWKIERRGAMGETIVGVCMLLGTTIHNELAIRLLNVFPKLVNDIYISEDYYGLSPLHQAIINHDPAMVSKILRRGGDVNARCFGAFFCAEDQKSSRTDSLEHEYVELSTKTNYAGLEQEPI